MIADLVLLRVFMYAAANRDKRGVTSGEAFICFTLRSFGFLPDFLLPMAHINIVARSCGLLPCMQMQPTPRAVGKPVLVLSSGNLRTRH